ncbi:MAG: hypothetical protein LBS81_03800 [Endomicrobium sp.]|nr:hypothetical protein [Endomicrobium sp.]
MFKSKESLTAFFKEINDNLMNSQNGRRTLPDEKKDTVSFVNSPINKFESERCVGNESEQIVALSMNLAVINDTMNELTFRRIADEAKKSPHYLQPFCQAYQERHNFKFQRIFYYILLLIIFVADTLFYVL